MDVTTKLRVACGHDSRSVDGCTNCEAADMIESMRASGEWAAWKAGAAAARVRLLPERDEVGQLLCSVADNLGDMPVSDEWAAKTAKAARDLLARNDYFRA